MLFNSYYNAKLLLTAEYLVLNGARALAVPLKFGQRLLVEEAEIDGLTWQSVSNDGSVWFEARYSFDDFRITDTSSDETAKFPQKLLKAARRLNTGFCRNFAGLTVVSTLNYPLKWGLGSSSTLIAAIAGWASIDPFRLHFEVSSGSGYDIACAINDQPLVYSLLDGIPVYKPVLFSPAFSDRIFFIYQGKKQDSAEGIKQFRKTELSRDPGLVNTASICTDILLNAGSLTEFESVMHDHEKMIGRILGIPTIRETRFSDLPGEIKSLGAWGGDFCMLTWRDELSLLPIYLKSKGIETCFNFHDIVL